MKHQSIEQRKKGNIKMAIATIIGLVNEEKIKQAVDVAMQHGITDVQFGIITRYAGTTNAATISENAEKIYKELFS